MHHYRDYAPLCTRAGYQYVMCCAVSKVLQHLQGHWFPTKAPIIVFQGSLGLCVSAADDASFRPPLESAPTVLCLPGSAWGCRQTDC